MSKLHIARNGIIVLSAKAVVIATTIFAFAGILAPALIDQHDDGLFALATVSYCIAFVVAVAGVVWIFDSARRFITKLKE